MITIDEITTWPETAELRDTPREAIIELAIGWLAAKSERKNILAIEALIIVGEITLPRLVREALYGPVDKRLRFLDVIERIGKPLGAVEFFDLQAGLRTNSQRVRSRIAQVLLALSPSSLGPSWTAEEKDLPREVPLPKCGATHRNWNGACGDESAVGGTPMAVP